MKNSKNQLKNPKATTKMDLSDRAAIELGLCRKEDFRTIAEKIGRHPSTIAREVKANRSFTNGSYRSAMTAMRQNTVRSCMSVGMNPAICTAACASKTAMNTAVSTGLSLATNIRSRPMSATPAATANTARMTDTSTAPSMLKIMQNGGLLQLTAAVICQMRNSVSWTRLYRKTSERGIL